MDDNLADHDGAGPPKDLPPDKMMEREPISDDNKIGGRTDVKIDSRRSSSSSSSNLKIYSDRVLGKGSYSKVFPGRYKDNMVAVKIISTQHLDKKITKQLERELDVIRVLQANPHPNIATYYKIFRTPEKMIIVMELCSGGELTKYIRAGLDFRTVKNYFSQILEGYKHLLSQNIVHRDIKSANLLLSDDKRTVKFIDFGLSKIFSVDLNSTICGSPLYMAPELLNHQDYDSKSDIWSIGVLLYEMVYGVTPFHNCKFITTLKQNMQTNKIDYPEHSYKQLYKVPKKLISYMKRLLELDPLRRIDWADLAEAEWLIHTGESDDELLLSYEEELSLYDDEAERERDKGGSDSDEKSEKTTSRKSVEKAVDPSTEKFYHDSKRMEIGRVGKTPGPSLLSRELNRTPEVSSVLTSTVQHSKPKNLPQMRMIPRITNIQTAQKNIGKVASMSDVDAMFSPFLTESDIMVSDEEGVDDATDSGDRHKERDTGDGGDSRDVKSSHREEFIPKSSGEKRSDPIPIIPRGNSRTPSRTGSYRNDRRERYGGRGVSYPTSYKDSDEFPTIGSSPHTPGMRGESFGDVRITNLSIDDISVIENEPSAEYAMILRKQRDNTSGSGLIDINDVNDILIANVPEKTTAFEYISKSVIGSYLYSRSAPIASNLIYGIGKVAKTTAEAVGIVSPK
ncbi:serine/threonine protein kinase [Yasminevirus sp. GU-2018]|uniref:Serine/threonine protein kinase n=1 Tax=Yasminevirus sp. GU-2018 TaxID=2420051 RepID=A0A5K0UB58_9VIRU|nr:serine/threonine protein kinase [Yasminevirus sp. GU-2018]